MPNSSFTVTARGCDIEPSRDGFLAVFNRCASNSGKLVHIHSIRTVQPSGANNDVSNTAGLQGRIGLYRITAYSGGAEKDFKALDTSASALPSQVKLMAMPDSVTTTDHLRSFGDAFSFGITKSIPFQALLRSPGVCDAREHPSGEHVWFVGNDAAVQRLTLREGEGIALVRRDYGQPQSFHWSIGIRVEGTGKCYRRTITSAGSALIGKASLCLFNGSGSGVVLGVYVIGFPDFGESNIPRGRVAKITGLDWVSGDTPTAADIAKHDTSADLTGVEAWKGPFVAMTWGKEHGLNLDYLNYQTTIPIAEQQRAGVYRHFLESDPWISLTHSPGPRFRDGDIVFGRWAEGEEVATDYPIVLQPGEGIAVLGGGNGLVETSEMAYYDLEVIGRLVAPDTPSGGATYSRGRVVNA